MLTGSWRSEQINFVGKRPVTQFPGTYNHPGLITLYHARVCFCNVKRGGGNDLSRNRTARRGFDIPVWFLVFPLLLFLFFSVSFIRARGLRWTREREREKERGRESRSASHGSCEWWKSSAPMVESRSSGSGLCVLFPFNSLILFIFAFLRDNLRPRKRKVLEAIKRQEFPGANYPLANCSAGKPRNCILYTATRTRSCSTAIDKTGLMSFSDTTSFLFF